jgi:site-specific DNA recombinase
MRTHGAFILARYSTDNQNPDSIEVQVEKCSAWCREHTLPVLGIFADMAVSGMKDTRPQYEAMMRQLKLGDADTVVIYDQSRMFRKMTAWFSFRDQLTTMGVSVVSVTQPMIGKDLRDPTNFLTEGSMALFNQIWALQTRQKVVEKMRFMARNCQHTGGKPPLGYKVVDGKLEICEEEAVIVRRIFNEYAKGGSYKAIINSLNADGCRTKRGQPFGANSLHDLLHNEKYIGTLVYGKAITRENGTRNGHPQDNADVIRIEDAIPAIVDKDLFRIVQERMALNKRLQGGRPATSRIYPLRSKVFCADCKMAMTIGISRGKYYYYRCTGKKRTHECKSRPINANHLEAAVIDAIKMILGTPTEVDSLIRILRDQAEQIQSGSVQHLRKLLQEEHDINVKLNNAVEAVLSGLGSQTIKDRITNLETEKATVQKELRALKQTVDATAIPEKHLRDILQRIIETPENDTDVLLSIVSRVEVSDEYIIIWTLLNADPNGHIDYEQDGVIITSGFPSAPPIVLVTSGFIRITVARKKALPD